MFKLKSKNTPSTRIGFSEIQKTEYVETTKISVEREKTC